MVAVDSLVEIGLGKGREAPSLVDVEKVGGFHPVAYGKGNFLEHLAAHGILPGKRLDDPNLSKVAPKFSVKALKSPAMLAKDLPKAATSNSLRRAFAICNNSLTCLIRCWGSKLSANSLNPETRVPISG